MVDSSALIPLLQTGKLKLLTSCFKTIIIPKIVWKEVVEEGKRLGKNIAALEEIKKEFKLAEAKTSPVKIDGLEKEDMEVLYVAYNAKEILLTNDATLYAAAISQGVKAWWLTILVIHAAKKGILAASEARNTVFELMNAGAYIKPPVLSEVLRVIEALEKFRF